MTPIQGTGLSWPAGAAGTAAGRPDVAPVCDWAPCEHGDDRFSGVVLGPACRARFHRLLSIWDNASWHRSHAVRHWIRQHNRRVKQGAAGVRIVVCPLPSKSPWLNPIEPNWSMASAPCRKQTGCCRADELEARVYATMAVDLKSISSCQKRSLDYARGKSDTAHRPHTSHSDRYCASVSFHLEMLQEWKAKMKGVLQGLSMLNLWEQKRPLCLCA